MNAESLCVPRDQPEKESKREKKGKKEKHGVTKLLRVRPNRFIFKSYFYTLSYTQREMKDAKSYRVSPNITSVLSLSKPGFFLQTFPINNIVYIIFWPWRPMNIL